MYFFYQILVIVKKHKLSVKRPLIMKQKVWVSLHLERVPPWSFKNI